MAFVKMMSELVQLLRNLTKVFQASDLMAGTTGSLLSER
jgi:hypothetical protein